MPAQQINFPAPLKGLNESTGYFDQPEGTTPEAINVCGTDPRTGRNRLSSRAGYRKYDPDLVNGTAAVQCLDYVTQSLSYSPILDEDGEPILGEDGEPLLQEGSAQQDFDRDIAVVAVAGGTVKTVSPDGTVDVTNGTLALSSTRDRINSAAFFGNIFFADGDNSKYYDASANAVLPWEPSYTQEISTASNATPIVITTLGFHTLESGQSITITGNSVPTINGTWVVTKITDLTFSLNGSVASGAGTGGEFEWSVGDTPVDDEGNRPTLICVWDGRIVVAGLGKDSRNLFGSAYGDAFNWDYSPAVTNVGQAFAAHLTPSGLNPDVITALVPISEDVLLVGGDHTIYRLRGNPVDGGRRDLLTDITGMAFGTAFCKLPDGTLFFIGSRGGLYRMPMDGGQVTRVSSESIDDRLSDLNMTENIFNLVWDDRQQFVLILITPTSGAASQETSHYYYDPRSGAFWEIVFSDENQNPRCAILFDGPAPDDRCVLMGGQDGYVRRSDVNAVDDDGYSINSCTLLGPVVDTMIQEMQCSLADSSGNVTWTIVESDSLQDAVDESQSFTGQFVGGRNRSQWMRAHVSRGYVRLSSSEPWSYERLIVTALADTSHRARIYA